MCRQSERRQVVEQNGCLKKESIIITTTVDSTMIINIITRFQCHGKQDTSKWKVRCETVKYPFGFADSNYP